MLIPPPHNCADPRLWSAALELAEAHAGQGGWCPICAARTPCPKAQAAADALVRAMPPPVPMIVDAPAPEPEVAPPVGARFPRERKAARRRAH